MVAARFVVRIGGVLGRTWAGRERLFVDLEVSIEGFHYALGFNGGIQLLRLDGHIRNKIGA